MADEVLWEGFKSDLANLASSGKLVGGTYQITDRFLIISDGLLTSKTQQIPLYCVANIEIKQTLIQKTRNVGDVIFTLDEELTGTAVFSSVENPKSLIPILNPIVKAARDRRSFGQGEVGSGATTATGVVMGPGGVPMMSNQDMISQLARLGQLRDTNLLSDEEFEAAKARIISGQA